MSISRFLRIVALFALVVGAPVSVLQSPARLAAQGTAASPAESIKARYTKYEYEIAMRDGVKLFTSVYVPKDVSLDAETRYPIMLSRTPYSVAPYGVDAYRTSLGPSDLFSKDGFIFVYQDVRGRYMSEGEWIEMTPHRPVKRGPKDIDESTDTYDTIDWLVKNIPGNNGRVGIWGISYPGFYAAAGIIDAHPALKAASPQAPIADLFMGDDAYHNGAFMLAANFGFYANFVPRPGGPHLPIDAPRFDFGTPDGYDFYLRMGPLWEGSAKYVKGKNPYWTANLEHTTYDEFWKSRSLVPHLKNITPAVMTVGGWYDAEDLAGPLAVYRAIEKTSAGRTNMLVMGPWPHGGWARSEGDRLGNVQFAVPTSEFYREKIEFPFFAHHLKDKPLDTLPEAWVFETGANQWRRHDTWPPKQAQATTFYFGAGRALAATQPQASAQQASAQQAGGNASGAGAGAAAGANSGAYDEFVSDPNRPVPYLGYTTLGMQRDYMTEDQRFAAMRPDVLVYETAPLDADVTITGPVKVDLQVSTSGTDADWVVKVIDVYPGSYPTPAAAGGSGTTAPPPNAVKMGGYQQLVRGEPFRGKFRNSFEKPEPFTPNQPARIAFEMPDVYHTFRKGHRIMVHVQSSWFPLVDRNPQKFLDSIPKATAADFQKATHRVYRSRQLPSSITVLTLGAAAPVAQPPTSSR